MNIRIASMLRAANDLERRADHYWFLSNAPKGAPYRRRFLAACLAARVLKAQGLAKMDWLCRLATLEGAAHTAVQPRKWVMRYGNSLPGKGVSAEVETVIRAKLGGDVDPEWFSPKDTGMYRVARSRLIRGLESYNIPDDPDDAMQMAIFGISPSGDLKLSQFWSAGKRLENGIKSGKESPKEVAQGPAGSYIIKQFVLNRLEHPNSQQDPLERTLSKTPLEVEGPGGGEVGPSKQLRAPTPEFTDDVYYVMFQAMQKPGDRIGAKLREWVRSIWKSDGGQVNDARERVMDIWFSMWLKSGRKPTEREVAEAAGVKSHVTIKNYIDEFDKKWKRMNLFELEPALGEEVIKRWRKTMATPPRQRQASGKSTQVRWVPSGPATVDGKEYGINDAISAVKAILKRNPDQIIMGPKLSIGPNRTAVPYGEATYALKNYQGSNIDTSYSADTLWEKHWDKVMEWGKYGRRASRNSMAGEYKNVEIKEGANGRGDRVYVVQGDYWAAPGGRRQRISETFDNLPEALNWVTHAMPGAELPKDPRWDNQGRPRRRASAQNRRGRILRRQILRLAKTLPEHKATFLGLLRPSRSHKQGCGGSGDEVMGCGCGGDGDEVMGCGCGGGDEVMGCGGHVGAEYDPLYAMYEEGKPADPTENMSPEGAKEWRDNTEKYRDKFKRKSTVFDRWACEAEQEERLGCGDELFAEMEMFSRNEPGDDPTEDMSPEDAKKWRNNTEKYRDKFKRKSYDAMLAKFEEGVSADPTENMSPAQKKKWWDEHKKNKDNFKRKSAGISLIELPLSRPVQGMLFLGKAPWLETRPVLVLKAEYNREDEMVSPGVVARAVKSLQMLMAPNKRAAQALQRVIQELMDVANSHGMRVAADRAPTKGGDLFVRISDNVLNPDEWSVSVLSFELPQGSDPATGALYPHLQLGKVSDQRQYNRGSYRIPSMKGWDLRKIQDWVKSAAGDEIHPAEYHEWALPNGLWSDENITNKLKGKAASRKRALQHRRAQP